MSLMETMMVMVMMMVMMVMILISNIYTLLLLIHPASIPTSSSTSIPCRLIRAPFPPLTLQLVVVSTRRQRFD